MELTFHGTNVLGLQQNEKRRFVSQVFELFELLY